MADNCICHGALLHPTAPLPPPSPTLTVLVLLLYTPPHTHTHARAHLLPSPFPTLKFVSSTYTYNNDGYDFTDTDSDDDEEDGGGNGAMAQFLQAFKNNDADRAAFDEELVEVDELIEKVRFIASLNCDICVHTLLHRIKSYLRCTLGREGLVSSLL